MIGYTLSIEAWSSDPQGVNSMIQVHRLHPSIQNNPIISTTGIWGSVGLLTIVDIPRVRCGEVLSAVRNRIGSAVCIEVADHSVIRYAGAKIIGILHRPEFVEYRAVGGSVRRRSRRARLSSIRWLGMTYVDTERVGRSHSRRRSISEGHKQRWPHPYILR